MYLATYFATQVAVKVLLVGHVASASDAERALTLSTPILQKLEAEASLLASLRWRSTPLLTHTHQPACYSVQAVHQGWDAFASNPPGSAGCPAAAVGHPPTAPLPFPRHPHIVNFLGVCHDPPAIVTEFCERGSLAEVLAVARGDPQAAAELTWARRLTMACHAAAGMLYLHTRPMPIVHRGEREVGSGCRRSGLSPLPDGRW